MTFIVHKEHGATNVSEADVPELVKQGWVVSTHAEWMAMAGKGPKVEPVETPADLLDKPERKKPGRKPKAE